MRRGTMNDNWQEVPDEAGTWWGVNPAFPHHYEVALVQYEGGRMAPQLRIHLAGDRRDYPVDHFRGYLEWQRAMPPIYFWPASTKTP
jgi:hypothetical protein